MSDSVALIIPIIIGVVFVIFAIILLAGKGGFLIAGYNTMSAKEKEKYDGVSLSKFIGKIFLPIGILCPGLTIGSMYNIPWLIALFPIVTIGLCVFALVYCNTANRFKK